MPCAGWVLHHIVVRIGTAEAATEKSALAERRLDALSDRGVGQQRPRRKTAKADQAGVERLRAVRNDMLPHGRMDAVGTDQEVTLGAGSVGEMRNDGLIGTVLDA